MSNVRGALGPRFLVFLRHNQHFEVIIAFINYDIKKLIMMQKLLVLRTAGLKPMEIRHCGCYPLLKFLDTPLVTVLRDINYAEPYRKDLFLYYRI